MTQCVRWGYLILEEKKTQAETCNSKSQPDFQSYAATWHTQMTTVIPPFAKLLWTLILMSATKKNRRSKRQTFQLMSLLRRVDLPAFGAPMIATRSILWASSDWGRCRIILFNSPKPWNICANSRLKHFIRPNSSDFYRFIALSPLYLITVMTLIV